MVSIAINTLVGKDGYTTFICAENEEKNRLQKTHLFLQPSTKAIRSCSFAGRMLSLQMPLMMKPFKSGVWQRATFSECGVRAQPRKEKVTKRVQNGNVRRARGYDTLMYAHVQIKSSSTIRRLSKLKIADCKEWLWRVECGNEPERG